MPRKAMAHKKQVVLHILRTTPTIDIASGDQIVVVDSAGIQIDGVHFHLQVRYYQSPGGCDVSIFYAL